MNDRIDSYLSWLWFCAVMAEPRNPYRQAVLFAQWRGQHGC